MDFRNVRIVDIALGRFVKREAVFGHDDWHVWQFDVLDRFDLPGQSQLQTFDFVVLDCVVDRFVNTLGRERFA